VALILPEQFQDLEFFADRWALPTEKERNAQRRASRMEEIQAFYFAMLPHMEEIITYLNQFPLDAMPSDARRLLYMALSFMEVSPAVELFHEPDESGVFPAERLRFVEPVV
jgi:hypothetical protein